MKLTIQGLRLGTGGNNRESWHAADRRKRREKESVWIFLRSQFGLVPPKLPLTITVTRVGPRTVDAHDNLPCACKYIVDEIARYLGVDDANPQLTWKYAQEKSQEFGVRIEIEEVQ